MEIIEGLLFAHIATGITALIVAPVAMIAAKGGKIHRLTGKVFFWMMTVVIITAVIISIYKFIPFLLMIAVLSYYSIVSGYRSLYHKQLHKGKGVKMIDWITLIVNGVINIVFIGWGVYMLNDNVSMTILASVFGCIGLSMSVTNLIAFIKHPTDKVYWLYAHINGFVGGYIATVTAFSVTVLSILPGIWAWIWPTMIGAPLIAVWIRRYKNKFNGGIKVSEVVILKSKTP